MFSSGVSFGLSSSSEANSISSGNGPTSTVFASRWQPSKSPFFGSTLNSTAPSTVFSFGASPASVAAPNISSMVVGSSPGTSTGSLFSFTLSAANSSSTSLTSSHPVFGNSNHGFTFGSASGNNDQMSMDYTMAEDNKRKPRPSQATFAPFVPNFGQPPSSSPSIGFVFNSITPSGANPFQFGGRQNPSQATFGANPFQFGANPFQFGGRQNPSQATFGANPFQFGNQQSSAAPPNQSPIQASGSLDFNAGGIFSLGPGGGDKSNRRILKVNKSNRRLLKVKRTARKK